MRTARRKPARRGWGVLLALPTGGLGGQKVLCPGWEQWTGHSPGGAERLNRSPCWGNQGGGPDRAEREPRSPPATGAPASLVCTPIPSSPLLSKAPWGWQGPLRLSPTPWKGQGLTPASPARICEEEVHIVLEAAGQSRSSWCRPRRRLPGQAAGPAVPAAVVVLAQRHAMASNTSAAGSAGGSEEPRQSGPTAPQRPYLAPPACCTHLDVAQVREALLHPNQLAGSTGRDTARTGGSPSSAGSYCWGRAGRGERQALHADLRDGPPPRPSAPPFHCDAYLCAVAGILVGVDHLELV